MTPLQMRFQELLPVIQAGADGRVIQSSLLPSDPEAFPWSDVTEETFGYMVTSNELRIKPIPKYRPYTPEEALRHCGRLFKSSAAWCEDFHYAITACGPRDARVLKDFERPSMEHKISFERLVEIGTWVDSGNPCGVEVIE